MVKLAIHLKTNKMILIFVLIYIGVSFHSLAEKFKKNSLDLYCNWNNYLFIGNIYYWGFNRVGLFCHRQRYSFN